MHSLNLFKSQTVPRTIIDPRGRRTGMSGDPLRDLDSVALEAAENLRNYTKFVRPCFLHSRESLE